MNDMSKEKVKEFIDYLDREIQKEWKMWQCGKGDYSSAYKFSAQQTEVIRKKFLDILGD